LRSDWIFADSITSNQRRPVLAGQAGFRDTSTLRCQLARSFGDGYMKNPLDSLWGTVISGLVLTLVLYVFANNFLLVG
jgi:hypothetical protein